MNSTTVLIVGAGPVGLTLACEMARRAIPYCIVERAAGPQQGSRAKGMQPRTLEIMNDLGIADTLMASGHTDLPYRKFKGSQLIGDTPRKVFLRQDTKYPKVLLLPQYRVEEVLRNKLATYGGSVTWDTTMVAFTQEDGGVTCRLESPEGTTQLHCRYMVACDGGKSTTRKQSGIKFEGETHQEEQLWVGDVTVEGLTPDAWYNWLSPEFGLAFALFPFKDSATWQLQAVMPPDALGNVPEPTLEGFNRLFRERTGIEGVRFTGSSWQSVYRVNIRRADRYRVGPVFIAGDACHVHSIAGGMGMNTGIQDAYNLGWKLAAVIKGEAGASLLDTYGEERIPVADWLLKATAERQKVMMTAATTGKGAFETLATDDGTQLNLNYRSSSLNGKPVAATGRLQPGDRAPDIKLADGTWLSEQLRGTAWKLLVWGSTPPHLTGNISIYQTADPALAGVYGMPEGVVLIRPDGYIALLGSDADEVSEYFVAIGYTV